MSRQVLLMLFALCVYICVKAQDFEKVLNLLTYPTKSASKKAQFKVPLPGHQVADIHAFWTEDRGLRKTMCVHVQWQTAWAPGYFSSMNIGKYVLDVWGFPQTKLSCFEIVCTVHFYRFYSYLTSKCPIFEVDRFSLLITLHVSMRIFLSESLCILYTLRLLTLWRRSADFFI